MFTGRAELIADCELWLPMRADVRPRAAGGGERPAGEPLCWLGHRDLTEVDKPIICQPLVARGARESKAGRGQAKGRNWRTSPPSAGGGVISKDCVEDSRFAAQSCSSNPHFYTGHADIGPA
jgi:hypothetical protein